MPNLTAAELKDVLKGGLVREDVMDQIWDISNIPLPFTDRAGSGSSVDNTYTEWTVDRLADPDLDNAKMDGADTIGDDDSATGGRLGNHVQISTKTVQVSTLADESDTIGRARELSYQISMRQKELRRDVEAISLSGQGSVEDTAPTAAGKAGSIFSFLVSNVDAVAPPTGFNYTTGLTAPIVAGAARPLTETMVRDVMQSAYKKGGSPTVFMSVPEIIRLFSEYLFTASARVATITADQGKSEEKAQAIGAVTVFVTDFGTLEFIPNRLQPYATPGDESAAHIGIFDFDYLQLGYMRGYQTEALAKTGLAEKRQMSVAWTTRVLNEEAQGAIFDIDTAAPVTLAA